MKEQKIETIEVKEVAEIDEAQFSTDTPAVIEVKPASKVKTFFTKNGKKLLKIGGVLTVGVLGYTLGKRAETKDDGVVSDDGCGFDDYTVFDFGIDAKPDDATTAE